MDRPAAKLLPVFLTSGVILFILLLKWALTVLPGINVFERAELFTYDWRARLALAARPPIATNLALVWVGENSLRELNQRWGYRWPWPRDVYGRVIRELAEQGATVTGIDGFFTEVDSHPPKSELGGLTPDAFLGKEMAAAGNVVVPTMAEDIMVSPPQLVRLIEAIRTNAWATGHDGIRGLDHANADRLRTIVAYVPDRLTGKPIWQLSILMAARQLNLDLDHAELSPGVVKIPRRGGPALKFPLGPQRQIYIDWIITPNHYPSLEFPFVDFYVDALRREQKERVENQVKDRSVLIGFTLAGDRANDIGANPVSLSMPQCYAHLNVLNSLITGRFIVRGGPFVENLLIALLAMLSALIGWRLRVAWGMMAFILTLGGYLALAVWLYVKQRYWLPVAAPLGGAFFMGYICLLSYRAIIERQRYREVRTAFGRLVSPNVFDLLARQQASALETCRRNVTVYFADVRGFTRYLEDYHARALKRIVAQGLQGEAAEAIVAERVGQSLATINQCLGEVADIVKAHDGTLDKYIGDCVMAFWGAPVPDEQHAVRAVRAAIAIHRALHAINLERIAENEHRQRENITRLSMHLPELEPLAILRVGSALNSGTMTVGFMGSLAHVSNYTVFGREVNIASRLEGLAEPDSILVTEATWNEVKRHDPALAGTFIERGEVSLHGIVTPVLLFEVPWQSDGLRRLYRTEADLRLNLPRL